MSKSLQLHIPTPCHENWNNMTPDSKGRFCLSCQKTVVDFTNMTDQEVIRYFQNLKGNTCGRFRDDQLNKDLSLPAQRKLKWYKYFLQIVIPTLLVTSKSYSQGEVKNKPAVCTSPTNKPDASRVVVGDLYLTKSPNDGAIEGIVLDQDKNPIAGATIMVKGTKQGVLSGEDGKFKLQPGISGPLTLSVAAIGYTAKELKVESRRAEATNIILQMEAFATGEVVVVAGYTIRKRKPNVYHQFKKLISDSLKVSAPKIYPNPLAVGSLLTVEYAVKKDGEYTVEVFDLDGTLIQVERFEASASTLQKQIRLKQGIAAGSYTLTLIGPDKKRISSQKIIVNM